jgi:hypothetical protein
LIMNNNVIFNPLNLRSSPQKFIGEVQPSPNPSFKAFQSFPYGIRAAAKVLLTYYREYGLNSIDKIIQRWAPTSDGNNTEAYKAAVAASMGIGITDAFRVADQAELTLLISSMAPQENPVQFSPSDLTQGVAMALGIIQS